MSEITEYFHNDVSIYPVCKRLTSDGSYELTFHGTIPAPPARMTASQRHLFIQRFVKGMPLLGVTIPKMGCGTLKLHPHEYLTYGILQINTENYKNFPEKINCCRAGCNPPIYVYGRISACMLNIFFFLYFVPIVYCALLFTKIAAIYNTYMAQVRLAAENNNNNNNIYSAESVTLSTIKRIQEAPSLEDSITNNNSTNSFLVNSVVDLTQSHQNCGVCANLSEGITAPTDKAEERNLDYPFVNSFMLL